MHLGVEPRKAIELSEKCGFKAYRLLHKEYDPVTSDTSFVLLEKVLKIGSWTAKNVTEESAALREAEIRLTELVR